MRAASLTIGAGRSVWGTLLTLTAAILLNAGSATAQCNGGEGGGNGGTTPPPITDGGTQEPGLPPNPGSYGGPADAQLPESPTSPAPPGTSPAMPPSPGLALVPEGVTAGAQGTPATDWRAWWLRNQDRYFWLASQRQRDWIAATDAALDLGSAAPLWTRGSFVDRLPRTETVLRAQLQHDDPQADAALQSLARLGLPIDSGEWADRYAASSTARWSAILTLGLRASAEDGAELGRILLATRQGRNTDDQIAAAYALGLIGAGQGQRTERLEALRTLGNALGEQDLPRPVRAACAEALGMAAHGTQSTAERAYAAQLAGQLLPWLSEASFPRQARAALAVSLARLCANNPLARSARVELTTLCIAQVQERSAGIAEQFGAVQALGLLIHDQESDVDRTLALLANWAEDSPNRDLRPAAMMALGQAIGRLGWHHPSVERHAKPALLDLLRNGTSDTPRWASLALGVAAAEAEAAGHGRVPLEVTDRLLREHQSANANDLRTTTALALGMAGAPQAHDRVRKHALDRNSRQDLAPSIDALALFAHPEDPRALAKFAKRKHLPAAVERSLARAFACCGSLESRLALYEGLNGAQTSLAVARFSVARHFAVADQFDRLTRYITSPGADRIGVTAALRALGRMQEARPGLLREACLVDRNPFVGNRFEAWMAEL